MTTYNLTSQQLVIRYNRHGQAYFKQKVNLFHAFLISTFLITLLSIGAGLAYNNYSNKQALELQYQNEKIAMESKILEVQKNQEEIALIEKRKIAEKLAMEKAVKEKAIHKAIVSYIATNYLISEKGAAKIVSAVIEAGNKSKVDFSLITAIIAIESRFNPYAKSVANAEGLMQVIAKWHPEKMKSIGGTQNIIETRENILAGSATIKDFLNQYNNNKILALQQYNGSLNDPNRKYSNLVLKEQYRIEQWIKQYAKV